MKIGILTFHSQLNYGGVLQCWALKTAMEGMGHKVVVVDRWLDPANRMLNGPFGNTDLKGWGKIFLRSLSGCGDWQSVLRHWRTRRFVKNLGLTPYHFYEWKDAPKDLGIDCLVVGSDQVWHGGDWGWPTPEPYLLKGAPSVRAIAYAASFGMKSLPAEYDYAGGFKRFSAISVREAEGVELVKSVGVKAVHVVDPTLLLSSDEVAKLAARKKGKHQLVCYFLKEDVQVAVPILERYAKMHKCAIKVLIGENVPCRASFPRSIKQIVRRIVAMLRGSKVKVCGDYGPREFAKAFAEAEFCVTDSFHAVMFSCLYGLNCRVIRPRNEKRKIMFARIEEFAQRVVQGQLIADNLGASLCSFDRGEKVSYRRDVLEVDRDASIAWLEQVLK